MQIMRELILGVKKIDISDERSTTPGSESREPNESGTSASSTPAGAGSASNTTDTASEVF